jgi:chromosome segregation ATPase
MERQHAVKAAGLLVVVGAVAIVALSVSGGVPERAELLSPLQVGRYAVRAERQGQDYDQKAERQIAFATDNDNAASGERDLAAKEEKRARDSAYLAADTKSRIDKVLEAGRDQVNQATKLKSKAGRLQEMAAELLGKAKTEKETAAALKAKYYTTMDQYGEAVQKIDTATQTAQQILDQMNAQSLTLAEVATEYGAATQHGEDPDAAGAQALKGQLQQAQTDLAAITAQKAQADEDTQEARKLADQYQPMIIDAEKDKRESDMHFQNFADLTHQADELQNRADALLARADTIDGLIQATQAELAQKRKNFEHYKNRAQTEMAISLQAEDKEALLRKQAREARYKAAELSDKARRLRALAQKGVNNVMESTDAPQPEE